MFSLPEFETYEKICRFQKQNQEQTTASSMKSFMCGEQGYIARFCRKLQNRAKICQSTQENHSDALAKLKPGAEIISVIVVFQNRTKQHCYFNSWAVSCTINDKLCSKIYRRIILIKNIAKV